MYRIWARHVDGVMSAPSEIVSVEVVSPLFLLFGNFAFNFISIIITLTALLFLLLCIVLAVWWRIRRRQTRHGATISDMERSVHDSFDNLHKALTHYIALSFQARTTPQDRERGARLQKVISKKVEETEQAVENEIEEFEGRKKP